VAATPIAPLDPVGRRKLALQREVSRVMSPIAFPLIALGLRFALGYRIEGLRELRSAYRGIYLQRVGPIMICANHLTMIDSFLIAWALGSPWWYFRHFDSLPWNVPERSIFAGTPVMRAMVYILKCLPIERGGKRSEVTGVLKKIAHVISRREVALIFPEAGRSRTGRVDVESAASGVGRVVRSLPRCQVLCVYLRGERQASYSGRPIRGERFHGALALIEPKTDHSGLRGSRDISQQVAARLADMEQEYFDGRQ
jgi:1-acyl-sn-glycerol-3-phosphate acyltransferase